ncbi:MAG: hypothetical protein HWN80_08265 [Candidatus Lokiarchaeota archaeon]|nr:hypothetical protein [Candidatus Lokiarchaeota archaeon]
MESLQTIKELKIETNKIFYDKKTQILSVYIYDIVFIGNYKKNAKISKILDDIYKSLGETQLMREDLLFVDFVTQTPINEKTKLKNLKLISKKEKPDKKEEEKDKKKDISRDRSGRADGKLKYAELRRAPEKPMKYQEKEKLFVDAPKAKKRAKRKEEAYDIETVDEEAADEDMFFEEPGELEEASEKSMSLIPKSAPSSSPSPPPAPAPEKAGGGAPKASRETLGGYGEAPKADDAVPSIVAETVSEEPKPTVYEINMGLQYYSVMMEKSSYLFYVYLSHKELKIVDEEGKTVFQTSFTIVTTKKEPPIVNLKVEGEGFEVHPLYGKVEIKKDAINPPVMIFSVLPVKKKSRTKKEKKVSERRYLHVYIEYEDNVINHSVLSIVVQPKHFRLDIGPFHLNLSKKAAAVISLLSIIIAVGSLIFTIFSFDPQSTIFDVVGNFAPGLGSLIFIAIFLITLFKEGIYPLKEKISYFLNFDNTGLIK